VPITCCRAKNITNRPRINEDPKDAMLREFQEEIMRLKAALAVGSSANSTICCRVCMSHTHASCHSCNGDGYANDESMHCFASLCMHSTITVLVLVACRRLRLGDCLAGLTALLRGWCRCGAHAQRQPGRIEAWAGAVILTAATGHSGTRQQHCSWLTSTEPFASHSSFSNVQAHLVLHDTLARIVACKVLFKAYTCVANTPSGISPSTSMSVSAGAQATCTPGA